MECTASTPDGVVDPGCPDPDECFARAVEGCDDSSGTVGRKRRKLRAELAIVAALRAVLTVETPPERAWPELSPTEAERDRIWRSVRTRRR